MGLAFMDDSPQVETFTICMDIPQPTNLFRLVPDYWYAIQLLINALR